MPGAAMAVKSRYKIELPSAVSHPDAIYFRHISQAHQAPTFGDLLLTGSGPCGRHHCLASNRSRLPLQPRIRSSAVTSLWPPNAVAMMIRSAGSP